MDYLFLSLWQETVTLGQLCLNDIRPKILLRQWSLSGGPRNLVAEKLLFYNNNHVRLIFELYSILFQQTNKKRIWQQKASEWMFDLWKCVKQKW